MESRQPPHRAADAGQDAGAVVARGRRRRTGAPDVAARQRAGQPRPRRGLDRAGWQGRGGVAAVGRAERDNQLATRQPARDLRASAVRNEDGVQRPAHPVLARRFEAAARRQRRDVAPKNRGCCPTRQTGRANRHACSSDLISYGGTPQTAWMPDSRHVVLALQTAPDAAVQLWLADTVTGERHALTSGTTGLNSPSIAPDGQRLIVSEESGTFDVVSVDLATASARALIASERNELMPAWAAADPTLVYVTDRSGPFEIWVHRPDGADRPVATARDFTTGGRNGSWRRRRLRRAIASSTHESRKGRLRGCGCRRLRAGRRFSSRTMTPPSFPVRGRLTEPTSPTTRCATARST